MTFWVNTGLSREHLQDRLEGQGLEEGQIEFNLKSQRMEMEATLVAKNDACGSSGSRGRLCPA